MAEVRFVAEVTPELQEVLVQRVQAAVEGLVQEVVCWHPYPLSKSSSDPIRCELEAGHDGGMCQHGDLKWDNPTRSEVPRNRRMELGVTVLRRSDHKPFLVHAITVPEGELPVVSLAAEDDGEKVRKEYSAEFWASYYAKAEVPARPSIRFE